MAGLRRRHIAALDHHLRQLATDARIVDSRRYEAFGSVSFSPSRPRSCHSLLWTKLIAAPVRPPMPEMVLLTEAAALFTVLPAELVTLERPCCALPAISDAPSLALFAPEDALLAASEVVDAVRRWSAHLDCLSARRGSAAVDMIVEVNGGCRRSQWQRLGACRSPWIFSELAGDERKGPRPESK